MKYRYVVITQSAGTTTVSHQGEFEAENMLDAGMELIDLFENLEEALEVNLKLLNE